MLKNILSGVMALTIAASMSVISASAASKGDVDGSGNIDIEDAVSVINHINGVKALTGSAASAADVNSSSGIDIEDAVAIINHVNGVSAIGGGGSSTTGGKLESLRKKYSGDYTIKLRDSEYGIIDAMYIVSGTTFYIEFKINGVIDQYVVCGSDGKEYFIYVSDKSYRVNDIDSLPADADPIGKFGQKFVKAENKGGMTYEYYQAPDYLLKGAGMIVYGFDSSSNLKTIEIECKLDSDSDTSVSYEVVSISKADKSKITTPDLSGFTEIKDDY